MLILGIESSCDDAGAALLETSTPGKVRVLANVVATQEAVHRKFGGVVPELASRCHVRTLMPVIETAFEIAGCSLRDVDGIAVTYGPGLVGSLLVGLMCAKGLAQALNLPLVGVNHIEGHILAPLIEHDVPMPYLALVVSGGHSVLFLTEDFGRYRRLGSTRDDAAGEAFDKVAKMMGLGYPGGRVIDEMARKGDRNRFRLPRAKVRGSAFDMSFSGIKTAVALTLNNISNDSRDGVGNDLAASFQEAVVDMLIRPTMAAAREYGVKTIALTGGVAANSRLRERLTAEAESEGFRVVAPSLKYCTDNATMIALAGSYRLLRGERDELTIDAQAALSI